MGVAAIEGVGALGRPDGGVVEASARTECGGLTGGLYFAGDDGHQQKEFSGGW